jgi:hypothetical protein
MESRCPSRLLKICLLRLPTARCAAKDGGPPKETFQDSPRRRFGEDRAAPPAVAWCFGDRCFGALRPPARPSRTLRLPPCSQAPAWEHNSAEAPASIGVKGFGGWRRWVGKRSRLKKRHRGSPEVGGRLTVEGSDRAGRSVFQWGPPGRLRSNTRISRR